MRTRNVGGKASVCKRLSRYKESSAWEEWRMRYWFCQNIELAWIFVKDGLCGKLISLCNTPDVYLKDLNKGIDMGTVSRNNQIVYKWRQGGGSISAALPKKMIKNLVSILMQGITLLENLLHGLLKPSSYVLFWDVLKTFLVSLRGWSTLVYASHIFHIMRKMNIFLQ